MTANYPKCDENGYVICKGVKQTIRQVEVFECPRVYDEKSPCSHSIFINFTDNTMFWGGGVLEAKTLLGLGYLPFMIIYQKDHPHLNKLQIERCEIATLIAMSKHIPRVSITGKPTFKAPININKIYYQLQSSTGVPSIYCTDCGLACNFAYKSADDIIAYWSSTKKERVLCHICLSLDVNITVKLPVTCKKDIPAKRAIPIPDSSGLWHDHKDNIKTKPYIFDLS